MKKSGTQIRPTFREFLVRKFESRTPKVGLSHLPEAPCVWSVNSTFEIEDGTTLKTWLQIVAPCELSQASERYT